MFKDYPDILTPKEAAKALGISQTSFYPRIGRKIIIPKLCLIDFVQSARYTVANP